MNDHRPFGSEQAYSVFEVMRPGPGLTIERMACLTYSLDLVAVTAMLISMSGQVEDELSGGPMCLADAIETLGPHLRILYQKGRLQVARRHFGILHLLDGMLHQVTPRLGASWHPKCVLARYIGGEDGPRWRLWIGSRNLTVSADREAGIVLCGAPGRSGRIPDIARMVGELAQPLGWSKLIIDELTTLSWQAPADTRVRALHWRRLGERKSFFTPLPRVRRTLVISPFVNRGGLDALGIKAPRTPVDLVTIAPTADALGELPGTIMRVAATPQRDTPATVRERGETSAAEAPDPVSPGGLHAKLVLQRNDRTRRLWIGSANATGRGLTRGNAEIVVELDVGEPIVVALEAFAEAQALAVVKPPSEEALAVEAAERALDDALQPLLEADFTLVAEADRLTLATEAELTAFLADYHLETWLFTYPDAPVEWPQGAGQIVLRTELVPLRLQTILVGFRATARSDPPVARSWAQAVAFPGLDVPARNRAATAAYIGTSNLAAWLRARLQGITPVETSTWSGGDRPGVPRGLDGMLPGIATLALEEVLSAWARNPAQFETRATSISDLLDGFAADLADRDDDEAVAARLELDEVDAFWSAVRQCLGKDGKNGA